MLYKKLQIRYDTKYKHHPLNWIASSILKLEGGTPINYVVTLVKYGHILEPSVYKQ